MNVAEKETEQTMLERVKSDQLSARKAKDSAKAAILTVLMAAIQKVGMDAKIGKLSAPRDTTEAEAISEVKKLVVSIQETLATLSKAPEVNADNIAKAKNELAILQEYMPTQLTHEELKKIITDYVAGFGKNVGEIMKFLKSSYEGLYDGKTAAEIIKTL